MRNTAIGALVIGALVGGCGGVEGDPDASVGGPEGGTLTFDAAMLGHDAGSSPRDGGADGGPIGLDAGGPVDGYPDVPRTHVGHPDWNLLTLVSHNVVQDPVTDFEQILLVVRNDHPSVTFCSVRFRFEVFDASGTSITWRSGTFDGDPRRIFSIDAGCIPPGTLGLGYGNARAARRRAWASWRTESNASCCAAASRASGVSSATAELVPLYECASR